MEGKYRFVAVDLDGTTLNNHHELTQRTISQFRALSSLGVTICIATGRSLRAVLKILKILDLPQKEVPVVCYNGALAAICRKEDQEYQHAIQFHSPLETDHIKEILEFCSRRNCVVQYYNALNGEVYAVPKDDAHHSLLKRYEILTGHPQTLIESYDPLVREYPSSKILIMTDSADEIISEVRRSLNCAEELTIFRGSPDPFFVEVLRKNVTKGHGLARLCEMLAVDMQEVVAFGDGENDREMLQFVGWGCAPSNAKADAKAAARKVLQLSNHEDAVALELAEMLESGLFHLP